LPRNFRVYAEFREIPRKHGNSAATAEFCGSARNSAARGKLWALVMKLLDVWDGARQTRLGGFGAYLVCLEVAVGKDSTIKLSCNKTFGPKGLSIHSSDLQNSRDPAGLDIDT